MNNGLVPGMPRRGAAQFNDLLARLWRTAGFAPNPNQRRAILHVDGPLHLPAGPGSGKTRVLLWRAVNLIVCHGVAPAEIFLSTFTEKAARQLREGIRALLGLASNETGHNHDLSRMYVGTIHSLCRQILTDRRFVPDGRRLAAPVLMDELSQYFHLHKKRNWLRLIKAAGLAEDDHQANQELQQIFDAKQSSRHHAVSNCISLFNRFSEECIDPAIANRRRLDEGMKMLLRFYDAYLASLREDPKLARTDFSLLQQEALRALTRSPDAGRVFRHVIIDEYQDTNPIQEKLFFRLAAGHRNLCVVGDDDQALYRFRGATVENFVEFPTRCAKEWGKRPAQIPLAVNYRSRGKIVEFCGEFIQQCDWSKGGNDGGKFRITEKKVKAQSKDSEVSVVATSPACPESACVEIARLARVLLKKGKVADPNQIAFLYPSLKTVQVGRMIKALEDEGLKVYAPRAKRFLEVDEAVALFGVFLRLFGRPEKGDWGGKDYNEFHIWLEDAEATADELVARDPALARFIRERQREIETVVADHAVLQAALDNEGWSRQTSFAPDTMLPALFATKGLSTEARRSLKNEHLARLSRSRPVTLGYVLQRAAALDWTPLDLFYRLCAFRHFKGMFDQAETGGDEGPICNLSQLSRYLARFQDEFVSILTGQILADGRFRLVFFMSFLYPLFRRGETENEDEENPFPRGRIPFLTIHQAKGLEFPVVVLGNPHRQNRGPQIVEKLVNPLLKRKGEPLERMAEFDLMRLFYVALSRAQNLLVIAHFSGRGQKISPPFEGLLHRLPRIGDLDLRAVPAARQPASDLPRTYSYTADYLSYLRCPRQYMIFRRYDFAPSRAQTMLFGSLVHQTIEDLHQRLIAAKRSNDANRTKP